MQGPPIFRSLLASITLRLRPAWLRLIQSQCPSKAGALGLSNILRARRPLWVVLEGGRVIGWLSYSSFYGRPAYDRTCEISIYLAREYQRRGLGSDLLRRSIEHAPAIGVSTLLGFIFAHNTPSLRLVEKHGFARWGYLPRVAILDGVERDLVIVWPPCRKIWTIADGPPRGNWIPKAPQFNLNEHQNHPCNAGPAPLRATLSKPRRPSRAVPS